MVSTSRHPPNSSSHWTMSCQCWLMKWLPAIALFHVIFLTHFSPIGIVMGSPGFFFGNPHPQPQVRVFSKSAGGPNPIWVIHIYILIITLFVIIYNKIRKKAHLRSKQREMHIIWALSHCCCHLPVVYYIDYNCI